VAVNALKRAIYTERVNPPQAKRTKKMQALADPLCLLANDLRAWNTPTCRQFWTVGPTRAKSSLLNLPEKWRVRG